MEGYAGECFGTDPAGWDVWQLMGVQPPPPSESAIPEEPLDSPDGPLDPGSPPPPIQLDESRLPKRRS
jgi:hypothetical protein